MKDLLPFCRSERQTIIIETVIEEGSNAKAAKKLGINDRSIRKVIQRVKSYTASQGLPPKHDPTKDINSDIIVIADTQVDLNSPTSHLYSLSKYIWEHKPSHIVHIGDHWDFPSLSSYASQMAQEGKRLNDDLLGGFDAFKLIMAHTNKMNIIHKTSYKPKKIFLMGNHENRLNRFIESHPILDGCFNLKEFIEGEGWKVYPMNVPVWIHDICFSHYMENAMSGRPVGGSMENKLNKFPHSFIHGHQQQYQYARRQNLLGKPHFGVCAGSFYMHDENYRGANNTEIRGFTHLRGFTNRYGFTDHDVEFVSMERLLENY